MVRKLFKHEIFAWCRIMPIVYAVFLCITFFGRILQFFESDSVAYDIIFGSSIVAYVIGSLACMFFPTVFGVIRFYKNLFTGEGYLSFTLPVTPANHIWVKLLTAVMFDIISFVLIVLSALLMMSGDLLSEIALAVNYLAKNIPAYVNTELPFFIIETALLLLVSCFYKYLLYYLCICIGQLFNKNRIFAAVGAYVVYYIISQVIGTIIGIGFSFLSMSATETTVVPTTEELLNSVHVIMFVPFLINVVLASVFFFINHRIMKKNLNLE